MTRDEINELKLEIYKLISTAKDSNKKKIYEKVIRFIDYADGVRHTLKTIAKIGGDHSI